MGGAPVVSLAAARSVTCSDAGTLPVARSRTTPQALTVSVARYVDRSLVSRCHHASGAVASASHEAQASIGTGWNAARLPARTSTRRDGSSGPRVSRTGGVGPVTSPLASVAPRRRPASVTPAWGIERVVRRSLSHTAERVVVTSAYVARSVTWRIAWCGMPAHATVTTYQPRGSGRGSWSHHCPASPWTGRRPAI